MEGKLIKMVEGYTLSVTGNIDDLYGISNHQLAEEHQLQKLSLKNCQAIENGYDLDELYLLMVSSIGYEELDYNSFEIGFLKSFEIFGDNKFNIRNMISAYQKGKMVKYSTTSEDVQEHNFIQSLQQTEWDVEIITEPFFSVGDNFHDKYQTRPKLDADGCLILKRK